MYMGSYDTILITNKNEIGNGCGWIFRLYNMDSHNGKISAKIPIGIHCRAVSRKHVVK